MPSNNSSGLQQDFSSSIAVKITAPVLWIIILIGVVIAIFVQGNIKQDLIKKLNFTADHLAYELQTRLNKTQWQLAVNDRLWLRKQLAATPLKAVVLTIGSKITSIGSSEVDWLAINREIVQGKSSIKGDSKVATLTFKHPPLEELINAHQRELLIEAGIPFLIFAFSLAGLIHVSVTRPITELVEATKAVTEGNLSNRISSVRNDEFGDLGKFMNEMLDKLQEQQEQLSEAVTAAEAASRAKSSFLANMSHEIRTPLTAIIGFSEVLREKDLSEEQRIREVEAIIRSGTHLQEIINDILDFSKIEAGQLVVEKLEVSPLDIVEEIRSLFAARAEAKGLKFNVKIEYPIPQKILTDPTRLKQIIINLCSNAIKFTRQGSVSLLVRYLSDSNKFFVSVTDTGIGMDEDAQKQIFQPFTQADVSTTRQFGGTGLGLCISNELAEKLGGEIRCNSKLSIGTQFMLEIDAGELASHSLITSAEDLRNASSTDKQTEPETSLRGRVLLAEDNVDNQRLLGFYLKRAGVEFIVVDNGAAAVRCGTSESFDLVLMDMQMPVMDGLSAIRLLRQQNFDKPIVVLTANVLAEDRSACEEAGANDFLTKPVDVKRFNDMLEKYLSSKAA